MLGTKGLCKGSSERPRPPSTFASTRHLDDWHADAQFLSTARKASRDRPPSSCPSSYQQPRAQPVWTRAHSTGTESRRSLPRFRTDLYRLSDLSIFPLRLESPWFPARCHRRTAAPSPASVVPPVCSARVHCCHPCGPPSDHPPKSPHRTRCGFYRASAEGICLRRGLCFLFRHWLARWG